MSTIFNIRMDQELVDRISAVAKHRGLYPSTLARSLLLQAVQHEEDLIELEQMARKQRLNQAKKQMSVNATLPFEV